MTDSTDGVLLYRLPRENNTGKVPVPRTDLIDRTTLVRTALLLDIFLPGHGEPRLVFTVDLGFIELPPQLMASVYPSVSALIDDVEDLNTWLADWASSTERLPDCRPEWASRHGIAEEVVRRIAHRLAHELAQSRAKEIPLCTMAESTNVLRVPARSQLVPPAPPVERDLIGARLCHAYRTVTAVTSTGASIYLMADGAVVFPETTSYSIPYRVVQRRKAFDATTVSASGVLDNEEG